MKPTRSPLYVQNNMIAATAVITRAGISKARFYQLLKEGKGPSLQIMYCGRTYYDVHDVDTWIQQRNAHVELNTYMPPLRKATYKKHKELLYRHTKITQFCAHIQAMRASCRLLHIDNILVHMKHLGITDFLTK